MIHKILIFIQLLLISPLVAEKTIDEKIGQLFIVTAYGDNSSVELIEEAIEKFHVGGILYNGSWDPASLRHTIAHFQRLSKHPLLQLQDQEWGLQMRHPAALRFPKNMTLGAIQDEKLIYELARIIGKQAKLVGITMNLAPVVDVNSNPKNPVIGDRSFGEDPILVAKKSLQYIKGLQDEGIIACAKHFPGHGDTAQDSHTTLPKIAAKELETCHLIPFHAAINNGVAAVMTAHLLVGEDMLPASLSPQITQDLLQKELGFEGVIITDDLVMKAISDNFTPKRAAQLAFLAGNDLIISSKDLASGIEGIKELITTNVITEKEIEKRISKIIAMQSIASIQPLLSEEVNWDELFSQEALQMKKTLYEKAITCPRGCEPHKQLHPSQSTLLIQIGGKGKAALHTALKEKLPYLAVAYLRPQSSKREREALLELCDFYDNIIISYQEMNRSAIANFGISDSIKAFINESRDFGPTHLFFGSPYALINLQKGDRCIVAYEDDPDAQIAVAKILLGEAEAEGRLPVLSQEWDS